MQVALALSPGVSADECEAFTLVFDKLPDVELVGVGAEIGPIEGQGGGHHVDRLFEEVLEPDVVLVPGGLGVERTARDDRLAEWLRNVQPTCQWMAASSTGTVVVAAAGLLDDHEAATHWLASPLLESYGSHASTERIVEVGRIITCEGRITAMHVALLVTLRMLGPTAVLEVREALANPEPRPDSSGRGLAAMIRDRNTSSTRRRKSRKSSRSSKPKSRKSSRSSKPKPRNPELEAPDVIELEPLRSISGATEQWEQK